MTDTWHLMWKNFPLKGMRQKPKREQEWKQETELKMKDDISSKGKKGRFCEIKKFDFSFSQCQKILRDAEESMARMQGIWVNVRVEQSKLWSW